MTTKTSDALVVGGGLAGLLASALLLKSGRKVLLLEKLEKLGGRYSPETRNGFALGSGFRFADAGPWRAAADFLGLSAPTLKVTSGNTLLHSTRGWIEPEEIPAWESYFTTTCTEFPDKGFYGITEKLADFCRSHENFKALTNSPLTAVKIEYGKVQSVVAGADQEISVADLYWTCEYKTLLETLQGKEVPEAGPERVSWLKKFVKSNPSPGVVLEFAHKTKFSDFTENLLLPFSSGEKEERRYLVGCIVSNRDPSLAPEGKALSSWILPLTELEWGDNHETMKKIRSARRLLEKAFPNFEASIDFDRVLVLDHTVTPLQKKKGEWLPLLPNLAIVADWSVPQGATPETTITVIMDQLKN